MSKSNIKLPSQLLKHLKSITNQVTAQKAVEAALESYVKLKKRQSILDVLREVKFKPDYKPLQLRRNDR